MLKRNKPPSPELKLLLTYVGGYPLTREQLLIASKRLYASPPVVSFFESLPNGTIFNKTSQILHQARRRAVYKKP